MVMYNEFKFLTCKFARAYVVAVDRQEGLRGGCIGRPYLPASSIRLSYISLIDASLADRKCG